MEETAKVKWYDNRGLVIVLLIVFFPVGIYALWKNYRFSTITKSIITAVFAFGLIFTFIAEQQAKDTISDANQLWESGNKIVAVQKYKDVIESNITAIDSRELPSTFQRVIEFDVENDNNSTAKYFIERAMDFDVPLAFSSVEANKLLAQVQQERKKVQYQGINVSFSQVMKNFSETFQMEKSTPVKGQDRYSGTATDGYTTLEIIGNKNNVSQATIMTGLPSDNPDQVMLNTMRMAVFVKNTISEFREANTATWVTNTITEIINSEKESKSVIYGEKELTMSIYKSIGMIVVTVKPV